MRAGRRRHLITFEQLATGQDTFGAPATGWNPVPFAQVMGDVRPVGGTEGLGNQAVQAETLYEITISYLPGLTQKMRATATISGVAKIFDIKKILNVEPHPSLGTRNRELVVMCREGLNRG